MIGFDLRTEPWIPVVTTEGIRLELGLKDAFLRAHETKVIAADNPLQTISLYRVLVGLTHHMVGDVENHKEWGALYRVGRFDTEVVNRYFDTSEWADRFDLFHAENPFWQVPGLINIDTKNGEERPVQATTIDIGEASGNNKTLFSHRLDSDETSYSPAQAARLLCTCQFFSLGGLNKKSTNRTGYQQSFFNAPLVSGMPSLLMGQSVFETVCLNLVTTRSRSLRNHRGLESLGEPPWAQKPLSPDVDLPVTTKEQAVSSSFFEYFLPWSRYIRLVPKKTETGDVEVSQLHIAQGLAYDPVDEPWTTKREDKKTGEVRSVSFNPERALWRDAGAFLGLTSATGDRQYRKSSPLDAYSKYRKDKNNKLPFMVPMAVFALANDKAKPLLWRQEELHVPDVNEENQEYAKNIQQCLETAESVGGVLKAAISRLAMEMFRNTDNRRESLPQRIADGSSALRSYWSLLDLPFRRFLSGDIEAIGFLRTSFRVAEESFALYVKQTVGTDVRYFDALSKAKLQLLGSLKKKRQPLEI